MRFLVVISSVLSCAVAVNFKSIVDEFENHSQADISDCEPVPSTEQFLFNCGQPDDIVHVHNVSLSPYPPKTNQDLIIKGHATLDEEVVEGATLKVVVKVGMFKLFQGSFDLCDELPKFGLKCPVEKGPIEFLSRVGMPPFLPKGRITVFADALTKEEKSLTHLKIEAKMN